MVTYEVSGVFKFGSLSFSTNSGPQIKVVINDTIKLMSAVIGTPVQLEKISIATQDIDMRHYKRKYT